MQRVRKPRNQKKEKKCSMISNDNPNIFSCLMYCVRGPLPTPLSLLLVRPWGVERGVGGVSILRSCDVTAPTTSNMVARRLEGRPFSARECADGERVWSVCVRARVQVRACVDMRQFSIPNFAPSSLFSPPLPLGSATPPSSPSLSPPTPPPPHSACWDLHRPRSKSMHAACQAASGSILAVRFYHPPPPSPPVTTKLHLTRWCLAEQRTPPNSRRTSARVLFE